jgi:hypothetical protein
MILLEGQRAVSFRENAELIKKAQRLAKKKRIYFEIWIEQAIQAKVKLEERKLNR